jgi:sulfate transport system permease protein
MAFRQPSILPGFGLTLGFTTFFLSAIVLLPLAALVVKGSSLTWSQMLHVLLEPARGGLVPAELRRCAACRADQRGLRLHRRVDAGALRLPGPPLVDALIDLPFALPTAVSASR